MVDEPPETFGPDVPTAPGKTKTVAAPGAGLRADGTLTKAAIEQIVTGGVQAAFMLMAAFTRPAEYHPAWQFSEKEVKPASDHFVRWLQTFEPERLNVMAKYVDPALGVIAMYGLYTIARLRERELEHAYANLVNGPAANNAPTDQAAGGHPPQDRGNGKQQSPPSNGAQPGPGLPRNFYS